MLSLGVHGKARLLPILSFILSFVFIVHVVMRHETALIFVVNNCTISKSRKTMQVLVQVYIWTY